MKRTHTEADLDIDDEPEIPDEVRLWESGFKDRYYESKFDVCSDDKGFRQKVALEYIKGLCWVLKYYYQVNFLILFFIFFIFEFFLLLRYCLYNIVSGMSFLGVVFSISLCTIRF